MKRTASMADVVKPLSECPSQAYLSNAYLSNSVQVADLLEWILEQVGTAKVWQTSFSISEEFLRRLFFIEKSGRVSEFNLVLDHKATNKTLKLWSFMTQVIQRTFLTDNHSKILLVQAENGQHVATAMNQRLSPRIRSSLTACTRRLLI